MALFVTDVCEVIYLAFIQINSSVRPQHWIDVCYMKPVSWFLSIQGYLDSSHETGRTDVSNKENYHNLVLYKEECQLIFKL